MTSIVLKVYSHEGKKKKKNLGPSKLYCLCVASSTVDPQRMWSPTTSLSKSGSIVYNIRRDSITLFCILLAITVCVSYLDKLQKFACSNDVCACRELSTFRYYVLFCC